ncbi:HEAT repeat domain-containing protein [Archangium violaceum]|uniref:HEAT repeat domain-containing protein n=1 Tax=Archangium violaceum TaxID=83451 RepID=UPI00194DB57C|nr:HEAT repeat domain-containing protein [Archangium violaceum]QRN93268.1 HEAT repeat domain-containing protein [Archangium violaceum]
MAQNASNASQEPAMEPATREKVEAARNFTFHLLKGIKQIGMYRHNEARFPEFLAKAQEALAAYTDRYGPLSLKVEQQNFMLHGEPLFSEDTPLPYKFFRDGIRQLIFRPGLTVQELVSFTLIALSEPERGAEDVMAQLWRAALEHLEYVMVEGFKMDEVSEAEVEVEVDKVVGYLYARLKTNSDDYLRFARVNADDLDSKMDGVEQMRGLVVAGNYASDELKARLQKEIGEEEGSRLFPKLVSAIFQVIEGGVDDVALLEEVFVQLLDAMLIQDDYAIINQLVLKMRAMAQRDTSGNISRLLDYFVLKMGEEQRVMRLAEMLKTTRPRNPVDITRYMQALDPSTVFTLLNALETIEIPENRVLVCDVLASFAKDNPQPFVQRLEADRPQTVRDMVYILEKSDHPDRVKMFGLVLLNKNLAVKLEVMNIIARGRTNEARKLIVEAINDPIAQVRMLAVRLLPEFDRDKAYVDLTRLMKDPNFEKKSIEERTAFYSALGSTALPGAISLMLQMLAVKPTLLNKKKVMEDKLLAVAGLAGACSIQSYKALQGVVEDKTQPVEILTAARKAMYQTKKILFGETAANEEA